MGCAIPTEEQAFEAQALCDKKPFHRLDFLLLFYQEKSSSLSGNERLERQVPTNMQQQVLRQMIYETNSRISNLTYYLYTP
jgi:hypothetical protein